MDQSSQCRCQSSWGITFGLRRWRNNFRGMTPFVTDEHTYFDLCPPGASRDPQFDGPSTSSDVPMTPTLVADEPVADTTADEPMPDTSEIPVLPNSTTYAPRVRWRSDVLELTTPTLPKCAFGHITRHTNDCHLGPRPCQPVTPTQPPITPYVEIQPETPLPVSFDSGYTHAIPVR